MERQRKERKGKEVRKEQGKSDIGKCMTLMIKHMPNFSCISNHEFSSCIATAGLLYARRGGEQVGLPDR